MSENHWIRFYSAYPKKEGRGAALKAWEKITGKMTPEELEAFTQKAVMAIDAQKRTRWDASERKYIPMPATWLNQCRWDDEVESLTQKVLEDKKKDFCGCGLPAFNRVHCSRCYTKLANPEFKEQMSEKLRQMGFTKKHGESWRDACMRCLNECGLNKLLPVNLK